MNISTSKKFTVVFIILCFVVFIATIVYSNVNLASTIALTNINVWMGIGLPDLIGYHPTPTNVTNLSVSHASSKNRTGSQSRSRTIQQKKNSVFRNALSWNGAPIQRGKPQWQPLDSAHNAFVYAAHFDDVDFPPCVRIIGNALAHNLNFSNVTCLFFSRHHSPIVHRAAGRLYRGRPPNGRKYIGAFVDCPLPRNISSLPFAVSVFKANDNNNSNYMIIRYSHSDEWLRRHNNTESIRNMFQNRTGNGNASEARDEIIRKRKEDKWRYNITRCFPALTRNYNNHLALMDMVAASTAMGVDRFVFYVEKVGKNVLRMLKMLEKEGLAEVHPWNLHIRDPILYYTGQFSAVQECLYRNLWSSRFVILGDVDELFVPRQTLSLMALLEPLFEKNPHCGAYNFQHTVFNCKSATVRPPLEMDPSGLATRYRLTSLTHVIREGKVWPPASRTKPVLDPLRVDIGGFHGLAKARKGFKQCTIGRGQALLHHYRCFKLDPVQYNDTYLWNLAPAILQRSQHLWLKFNTTVVDRYP